MGPAGGVQAFEDRAADREQVADLTVEATERVVGKVLDSADQRRLVEEAVQGLDFSALEKGSAN